MDEVYDRQQRRKAAEPAPRAWSVVRAAIEEAKGAREAADVGAEIVETLRRSMIREAEARIDAGPPTGGIKRIIPSPNQSAPSFAERTLVDALWNDMFGGVGDER